jgi:DNA-binding transcriptional LysR family regulator
MERIAQEPFIMREPGSGIRHKVEDHFARHQQSIKTRLVLDGNEAIKLAVAGRLGVSVVSAHALNLENGQGPLVKLDVQSFPLQSMWNIVYPRGKALSVVARQFLSFLKIHGGDYLHIG